MSCNEPWITTTDPFVKSILDQHRAIKLLAHGLRPKQVGMMTGLSNKRINNLRRGLFPAEDRRARPGTSPATILRYPQRRAAAAIFLAVYKRYVPEDTVDPTQPYLLPAYRFYQDLMVRHEPYMPILAIDDAYTLLTAVQGKEIERKICDSHGTGYLIIPDFERKWGCPFCSLAAGEWSLEDKSEPDASAGTEASLGVRSGAKELPSQARLDLRLQGNDHEHARTAAYR